MRRGLLIGGLGPALALGLLLTGLAGPAAAVPQAIETELFLFSPIFPGFQFSGGGVATPSGGAGGPLTALSLPAGVAGGTTAIGGTVVVAGLQATAANAAGVFTASGGPGGGFGGVLPLSGSLRLCLGGTCAASPPLVLSIPLSVIGAGGTTTRSVSGFVLTLRGTGWTTGTVTVSAGPGGAVSVNRGFREGPLGSASSTALPSGVVSLVTPILVTTNLVGFENLGFSATLDIHFVPEPDRLLLLAGAALALALAAAAGAWNPRGA